MRFHSFSHALRRRYGRAARGKGQAAVLAYLNAREQPWQPVDLTSMIRSPAFRGMHLKAIISAVQTLKKQAVLAFDGKTLTRISR